MRVERIKWSTVSIWTLVMTINCLNCKNFKKNANCIMKINKFVTNTSNYKPNYMACLIFKHFTYTHVATRYILYAKK